MRLSDVVVAGVATWRVSNMLVNETGPFGIFTKLRELTGIEHDDAGNPTVWDEANPLGCVYCTSVWVAPIMLTFPLCARIFAVSGIALLVDEYISRKDVR